MKRTNLYLEEGQIAALLELSGDESLASEVRNAINLYLTLYQNLGSGFEVEALHAIELYLSIREGYMRDVLAEAYRTFPEVRDDAAAIMRLGSDWKHSREENSKRGALGRIEKTVGQIDEELKNIRALMEMK